MPFLSVLHDEHWKSDLMVTVQLRERALKMHCVFKIIMSDSQFHYDTVGQLRETDTLTYVNHKQNYRTDKMQCFLLLQWVVQTNIPKCDNGQNAKPVFNNTSSGSSLCVTHLYWIHSETCQFVKLLFLNYTSRI